jgi:hypothetical protein
MALKSWLTPFLAFLARLIARPGPMPAKER